MEFTPNVTLLYDCLINRQFEISQLKTLLESHAFSADEVSEAAYHYVDRCCTDLMDIEGLSLYEGFGGVVPGCPSSHMVEAVQLLLEYGLNPNAIYNDETLWLC